MKKNNKQQHEMNRRQFLERLGLGSATALTLITVGPLQAMTSSRKAGNALDDDAPEQIKMTYRVQNGTGEHISLLGFGMMRLPREQEQVNELVDYALAHGVNYFDTAPIYGGGSNEEATGKALSRHPRDKYYVATKMSNQHDSLWSFEKAKEMYDNSFRKLQVDYIDYYLLHAVGGSMEEFNKRYVDNGIMDFLVEERKAGRIRNLGFSFHGRQEVFDEVLTLQDKYHWDFVQIELNWLDWNYANEINDGNVDASYLYAELHRLGIPAVIMEPLLGGRLAKVPQYVVNELKQMNPEKSIASWAFRYAGTPEGVLTVLSGMTFTEHLKDNLLSYCPLAPLTKEEQEKLDTKIAHQMMEEETIPCNACQYCMPCPYGIDIPTIFTHYNKMKIEGRLPLDAGDPQYRENRRRYLISLDREVERERQPDHCIKCGRCIHEKHCPQQIRIPEELDRISRFIEELKRS